MNMVDRIIGKMITYFETDVRRVNHALKVYGFASCMARREGLSSKDSLIVDIAAVLHDIGIHEAERKHHSSGGKFQELEGPAIARELLVDLELDPATINRICFIIGNHHSYQKIDGLDFQLLVEADFLVNIYEDEMPRHSIESVRDKYFVSKAGLSLLNSLYLPVDSSIAD
jgi:HD superfamily phosphodiesterase